MPAQTARAAVASKSVCMRMRSSRILLAQRVADCAGAIKSAPRSECKGSISGGLRRCGCSGLLPEVGHERLQGVHGGNLLGEIAKRDTLSFDALAHDRKSFGVGACVHL